MAEEINAAAEVEQDVDALKAVRLNKLNELVAAGDDPFKKTSFDVTAHAADITAAPEEGKTVSVAGSLMSKLILG